MSQREAIRVLLFADQALSLPSLRESFKAHSEMKIMGECASGIEAVHAVRQQAIELMILDIESADSQGFAALEILSAEGSPYAIFVTHNEGFAARAFEFNTVDYLLKPFAPERFDKALLRVRKQLLDDSSHCLRQQLLGILQTLNGKPEYAERFLIKNNGHILFVKTAELDWIEAEGNYVRLHCGKQAHLLRDTISALEAQLDPKKFLRVHRSTIVNLDRVKEMHSWFHGDYRIIMQCGAELMLSRRYRDRLSGLFGREL
ncbi:MAG: response regulator transcription factor [Acidobacteria bacterium]|nr:response regulator transcription factor [Acidobacteriota bacterium]